VSHPQSHSRFCICVSSSPAAPAKLPVRSTPWAAPKSARRTWRLPLPSPATPRPHPARRPALTCEAPSLESSSSPSCSSRSSSVASYSPFVGALSLPPTTWRASVGADRPATSRRATSFRASPSPPLRRWLRPVSRTSTISPTSTRSTLIASPTTVTSLPTTFRSSSSALARSATPK
ncbi:hypothetical protein EXIGLDRAFT_746362, partial [Exidia glandulosa HHB12029]